MVLGCYYQCFFALRWQKPKTRVMDLDIGNWGYLLLIDTRREFKAHQVSSLVLLMFPCSENRTGVVSSINHHEELDYPERFCPTNFF